MNSLERWNEGRDRVAAESLGSDALTVLKARGVITDHEPVARPCGAVRRAVAPSAFARAGMATMIVCTRRAGHTGPHA